MGATYKTDSMPVGLCRQGEALNKCKGGGNAWGNFGYRGGWCKKGQKVGITITCSGKAKPTVKPPAAKKCPVEGGFCVKSNGSDQNSGVVKLNSKNVKTAAQKAACLKA